METEVGYLQLRDSVCTSGERGDGNSEETHFDSV